MDNNENEMCHPNGEHYSNRAGHNRQTKSQKRRRLLSNLLFIFLSIIALVVIAINLYDDFVGLF